jgi:poly(3-hydroxybutyrate) depolymerase
VSISESEEGESMEDTRRQNFLVRHMRRVVLAALLAGAGVATMAAPLQAGGVGRCTPARPSQPGITEDTLHFGGLDRDYELSIPRRYDGRRPAPLVVNLHGFGGTGPAQDHLTDMPAQAGKRGYVVVAPDGGPLKIPLNIVVPGGGNVGLYEGMPFWNIFSPGVVDFGPPDGQNLGIDSSAVGADDVGFVAQLLDTLSSQLCLDANRIYVTGMSNGAGMATAAISPAAWRPSRRYRASTSPVCARGPSPSRCSRSTATPTTPFPTAATGCSASTSATRPSPNEWPHGRRGTPARRRRRRSIRTQA